VKSKKFGPFTFKIDRPAGYVKEWPRPDGSVKRFTYPVDYGYWPKIKGEDGEGLDAFVGDDEKGHLESFQKLNPDGSLDETKFLLGVSDAEREKIYKLYGTEVHARRVYETFDDVQKALDTFKTKMHKSEKKLADFHAVKTAMQRREKKLADFHAVKHDSPPADLSAQVGSQQYYLSRAKDFRDRHPDLRAPDYYHDYGDKYVHRFATDVAPKLTPQGRDWLDKTTMGLQLAIENKRAKDPSAFDRLERDPDAFRRFAFDSHPRAYLNAGLKDLPLKDLVRVGLTPDVKDILTPSGITQVARTAKGYVKHAARFADFHAVKCASNVFNALNWIPEPYQDRVQTPYQMLTSARNTPALTATQPNLRMLQISRENPQY